MICSARGIIIDDDICEKIRKTSENIIIALKEQCQVFRYERKNQNDTSYKIDFKVDEDTEYELSMLDSCLEPLEKIICERVQMAFELKDKKLIDNYCNLEVLKAKVLFIHSILTHGGSFTILPENLTDRTE